MKTYAFHTLSLLLVLWFPNHSFAQYHARFVFDQPVTSLTMDENGNSYVLNKLYGGYINITKLDTSNNVTWSKNYWNPLITYSSSHSRIAVKFGKVYLAYFGEHSLQLTSGLMQLDDNGNLEWHRKFAHTIGIHDTTVGPTLGVPVKILITADQVATVWYSDTALRILNYDNTGNLNYQVSLKNNEPFIGYNEEPYDAVLSGTGNIMIVGRSCPFWFGCSIRMSNGNINWHHVYEEPILPSSYYPNGWVQCIEELGTNKFIIAGTRDFGDEHNPPQKGFFSIMDSSGNVISSHTFRNNTVNTITRIKKLDDGKLHLDLLLNDTTEPSPGLFSGVSLGYASKDIDSLNGFFYALVENGSDDYCMTPIPGGTTRITEERYMYPHFWNNKYYYREKCKYFVAEHIYNTCTDYEPYKIEAIDTFFNYTINSNYHLVPNINLTEMTTYLEDNPIAPFIDCGNFIGIETINTSLFYISPNPASNFITVNTNLDLEDAYICIYNIHGQQVKTFALKGSDLIDISDLINGIYFYQFISKNKIQKQDKFIILK